MLPDPISDLTARHPAGLFCRKQAFRAGFNDGAIHRWVTAELITRLAPGWYRDELRTRHPLERQHLAEGYFARSRKMPVPLVSGTAALEVLGAIQPQETPPTVLIPWASRVRVRTEPFLVKQVHHLDAVGHSRVRGIRIAEPARALADALVVECLPPEQVAHHAYLTMNSLRLRVGDLVRRWKDLGDPGSQRMLELASLGLLDVESPAEWALFSEVFGRFPPAPDAQVQITDRFRADFAYVFAALVLEYQSELYHADRIDEDGLRNADFRRRGWDSLAITKSMLNDPAGTADLVHGIRLERKRLVKDGLIRRPELPRQQGRRTPLRTLVPLG